MRVCHITSAHPPFDVRIFHKECRSLARAGYEVTLVAPADFKERVVEGIRVLGVSPPASRRQRPRIWRELLTSVRQVKPDLVHFHDPDLLLIVPFLKCEKLIYDCHERNAVAMLNKPWMPKPLGRFAYLLTSFLEPALARRTTAVVLVDDSQMETFEKTGRPLVMVKNFPIVDKRPSNQQEGHSKAVVHVGAHARSRGCSVMIKAFDVVTKKIPDAMLWLVGPFNHPPYEREIRQLIVQSKIQDKVRIVGPVPYPEALNWINQASIGLVALQPVTQYQGALPTKLLEYMAAGVPVVAGNILPASQILKNFNCGIPVEPSNPEQYAEAIIYLFTHPQKAQQLGKNGHQAVLANYNWHQEEEKLVSLYASIQAGQEISHQGGVDKVICGTTKG